MRVTKNLNKIVKGACDISLGISIVVAIGIGVAIGLGLRHLTGSLLLLCLGIAIGIAAAFLNVYRACKALNSSLKELENDPKYKADPKNFDDDDELDERD